MLVEPEAERRLGCRRWAKWARLHIVEPPFERGPQRWVADLRAIRCFGLGDGLALATEETVEIVPHNGPILTTVLNKKPASAACINRY
jgi:hypothetical protein